MSSQGLRSRWAAGETAFGGWCSLDSAFSAELLGSLGFDYVCVDCQHGLIGYDAMWPMVQALAWHRRDAGRARAFQRRPVARQGTRRGRGGGHRPDGELRR